MVINVDQSQEGHHLKREGVLIKMRAGKEDAPLFPFDRIPASAVFLLQPHGPCQPVNAPCSWEMVKDAGRQLGGSGAGTPWQQCFPLLQDGAGQTVPLFYHITLGLKQWVPLLLFQLDRHGICALARSSCACWLLWPSASLPCPPGQWASPRSCTRWPAADRGAL